MGLHISILTGQHQGLIRRASLLGATVLAATAMTPASARQCEETNWQTGYESSLGIDRLPSATATLDHDGDGVATLFASSPGGAMGGTAIRGLARWSGGGWQAFGPGFSGSVARILLHDLDGDGSASLVVAGRMQLDSGGPPRELIAWNGSGWTPVSDVPANGPYLQDAASVDLDGDGVATLFATRRESAPAADTQALVRWDGAAWIAVDPTRSVSFTSDGFVSGRLAAHDDDGDGVPSLYAALHVREGSEVVALGLARYDGAALGAVSSAANPPLLGGRIDAMQSGDLDADGVPDLVVAGRVTSSAPPAGASGIVVLEGGAWSVPGAILTFQSGSSDFVATVSDVAYADDDGDGVMSLFATGYFDKAGGAPMPRIARLSGSNWVSLGAGLSGGGTALESLPGAKSRDELIVFGSFTTAGSAWVRGSARWNGSGWGALGAMAPTLGVDAPILGTALFDHDGDGVKSVIAAGQFRYAGTTLTQGVALFDGSQWTSLGGLAGWTLGGTAALVADLDGDGVETLYVAGTDGGSGNSIAAFVPGASGGGWSQLGGAVSQRIGVMAVADHDGDGIEDLFAAGTAGSSLAPTVLRWTGAGWVALAGSLSGADAVNDLVAFDDDGDGRASLFAAAGRNDPNVVLNRVRKWSAGAWTTVGAITKGHAFRLEVFDHDGDGTESLVVFGQFLPNNAYPLSLAMTLSGSAWSTYGPTTSDPFQAGCWVERFDDDGDGAASVFFATYDPFSARNGALVRLDGVASTVIASEAGYGFPLRHELDLDGDGARSLHLFGDSYARPGAFGSGVAEIEQCVAACPADLDGDASVGPTDLAALFAAWGPCGAGSCAADLDRNGKVGATDLAALLSSWGACR